MTKDDLSRSAAGMIRSYGADAERVSIGKAEKFAARGIAEAARNWTAISQAIREMRRSSSHSPHHGRP
jgi:hypothetical protein